MKKLFFTALLFNACSTNRPALQNLTQETRLTEGSLYLVKFDLPPFPLHITTSLAIYHDGEFWSRDEPYAVFCRHCITKVLLITEK